jgi:hypothetical protein
LLNGKVLVAGGSSSFLGADSTAELFDPATGTWTATGSLNAARSGHTATLLPNGKVLVARGFDFVYLSSAELYDPLTGTWTITATTGASTISPTANLLVNGKVLLVGGSNGITGTNRAELYDLGLGFVPSQQPQLLTISTPVPFGSGLVLTGSQFRGLSEGSGGSLGQNSPTDFPLVQVRSLQNEQTSFVLGANWSPNTFLSGPLTNLPPGWAMATVYVNAIPGTSKVFNIAAPTPFLLTDMTIAPGGAFQFGFTNTPNSTFTVLASANAALPLGNWIVLGTVTETSPGQYQFNDPQATDHPQRFYRVRWP